ncbi:terpenoid synthase [Trametes elegans]|nr:terpenoid synthase [Trametes elegans]
MTTCEQDPRAKIHDLIRGFLHRCHYHSPQSKHDDELRAWLTEQIQQWALELSPEFIEKAVDACCIYVETVYGHNPPEHRRYIALYSACMMYADDMSGDDPESITRFAQRFVTGEEQPNVILECLAKHLRRAYSFWPQFGADSIITGTMDALSANHIERATRRMHVKPHATRYPTYLRMRAGISAPYTHFVFPNTWRETPESYIQIIPDFDYWTLGTNLSFYKEELAGERTNYIHLRAEAEQRSIEDTLSRLVEEVLATASRVKAITADDKELSEIWTRYTQTYLEFHLKTARYRLSELGFHP